MRWTVLIALKSLPAAKSRLLPASRDLNAHRALVDAIRADTVAAARQARTVARVVLVVDRLVDEASSGSGAPPVPGDDLTVLVQRSSGLNGALRDGAATAEARWPQDGIAALVGDLPALRPDVLDDALAAAAAHEHAYVADSSGSGTTLLTAAPGRALRPGFGAGSAARHARHAVALEVAARVRVDVDTVDDLDAAAALGLGPATSLVLGRLDRSPAHGIVTT